MQFLVAMTNMAHGLSLRAYRYARLQWCFRAGTVGVGTFAIATVLLASRNLVLRGMEEVWIALVAHGNMILASNLVANKA